MKIVCLVTWLFIKIQFSFHHYSLSRILSLKFHPGYCERGEFFFIFCKIKDNCWIVMFSMWICDVGIWGKIKKKCFKHLKYINIHIKWHKIKNCNRKKGPRNMWRLFFFFKQIFHWYEYKLLDRKFFLEKNLQFYGNNLLKYPNSIFKIEGKLCMKKYFLYFLI